MVDEKDRLGEKLRQKEKAEENRFFAERDKAALERLRKQKTAAEQDAARQAAPMRCPKDGERLASIEQAGVTAEQCPTCQGLWFDKGEVEAIAARERDSWLGRFFFRPKR
jgi:DNA repair exonuclease SbcCD ATPase subunit